MAQLHVVKKSLGNQARMIAAARFGGLAAHLGTGVIESFPCSTGCPITRGQGPSAKGLRAFPLLSSLYLIKRLAKNAPEVQDIQV